MKRIYILLILGVLLTGWLGPATAVAQEPSSEERAKQLFEARQKRQREKAEAEEAAKRAAAEKAEAEAQAKREAEEAAKRAAEEKAAALAKEQAEAQAEEQARREALVQKTTAEAESGNATAQYELAQWYREGRNGLSKDTVQAAQWYMKVARNKDELAAKALYAMGLMYKIYNGRTQESFYREAALLGHAEALKKLGMPHVVILKRHILAEAGIPLYQYKIGLSYATGEDGLSQNYAEAMKWLTQAAQHNTEYGAKAMYQIGKLYNFGHGVARNSVLAYQLYLKAAALGNGLALYSAGFFYDVSTVAKTNKSLKKEYFIRAVWAGYALAIFELEQSFKMKSAKLVKHTLSEAKKGNAEAQYALGRWYLVGAHGLKKNYAESMQWFTRVAAHTTLLGAKAMTEIGGMWQHGLGVEKRADEAHAWYLKAAALGNGAALYALGCLYQKGHGVEKDLDKALAYYKQALVAGHDGVGNVEMLEKDFGLTALDLAEAVKAGL